MDKQHNTNKSIIHNTPDNAEAQITSTQMHMYQQLVINQKNMTHMCITKGGHWQSTKEHTHTYQITGYQENTSVLHYRHNDKTK